MSHSPTWIQEMLAHLKTPYTSAASLKYIALNRLITVATVWTQNTKLSKLNLVFIQKGSLAELVYEVYEVFFKVLLPIQV